MPDLLPKGLPLEVAKRLNLRSVSARQGPDVVEIRLYNKFEYRQVDDNVAQIHGYATVYDWPYDVSGGADRGGFSETIARGATKKSIQEKDDVRLLMHHDGTPLARTKSGTMTLSSDDTGLLVDADLDLRSTTGRDAALAMERGDLDEMSFAFQAIRQEWNEDYTERLIREVKLFDVSLVTFPANPAASAYLRADKPPEHSGMSLSLARAEADALALSLR